MIYFKKNTLQVCIFFIATFFTTVIYAESFSDGLEKEYRQPVAELLTVSELYEQLDSPLSGDFVPVNEFFLWGAEGSAINITDVVGDLQSIGDLLKDLKPESLADYQDYFF